MWVRIILSEDVPNREDTRLARAPQSFYLDEIIGAHRKAMAENKYDFIDFCLLYDAVLRQKTVSD